MEIPVGVLRSGVGSNLEARSGCIYSSIAYRIHDHSIFASSLPWFYLERLISPGIGYCTEEFAFSFLKDLISI